MRLGVYADLVYSRDGQQLSTSTAFVHWFSELAGHFDELVVFGRVNPEAAPCDYQLRSERVRFVELPYYPSLHSLGKVVAAAATSAARWQRALNQCDCLLLFGPHPLAVLFGIQARAAHRPVVVGVRQDFPAYISFRTQGWRRNAALPAARGLEACHKRLGRRGGVVAVGEDMTLRYATATTRILSTGISLLRASDVVSEDELESRPWPGKRQVLAVGRLDPEKNPMLLLEVGRRLRELGPWTLVIAGTGALAPRLAAEIKAQSLEDVITMLGRLDARQLGVVYRESTLLVHVSHTEGQPQVLYEAAAAGLPMIATDVGGISVALAHGRRGMLVPPNDTDAIIAAIATLNSDSGRRSSIVQSARAWALTDNLTSQTVALADFIAEIATHQSIGSPQFPSGLASAQRPGRY
ncbi:MAG: glycosyltransferase [Acidimicrobiales bacterium]